MVNKLQLAPSVLSYNSAFLGNAIKEVADAKCEWVHIDIMDGHFVPNLSFGSQVIKDLKTLEPNLFFDTHLMLDNPHLYIESFAKAGADLICVHLEPDYPVLQCLQEIHLKGCQVGIAINPKTDVSVLYDYLPLADLVLLMSVQPGFGGQKFQDIVLEKTAQLKKWRDELKLNFRIEVDGGITLDNVDSVIEAGADTIVSGTSFFNNPKAFAEKFEALQKA